MVSEIRSVPCPGAITVSVSNTALAGMATIRSFGSGGTTASVSYNPATRTAFAIPVCLNTHIITQVMSTSNRASPGSHRAVCDLLGNADSGRFCRSSQSLDDSLGTLFLPRDRPRRFRTVGSFAAAIHAGGRPRRFPRPVARRSRLRIASSIWACSWRNSASMLLIFIRVRISQGQSVGDHLGRVGKCMAVRAHPSRRRCEGPDE
jgi:hypothetical protein